MAWGIIMQPVQFSDVKEKVTDRAVFSGPTRLPPEPRCLHRHVDWNLSNNSVTFDVRRWHFCDFWSVGVLKHVHSTRTEHYWTDPPVVNTCIPMGAFTVEYASRTALQFSSVRFLCCKRGNIDLWHLDLQHYRQASQPLWSRKPCCHRCKFLCPVILYRPSVIQITWSGVCVYVSEQQL